MFAHAAKNVKKDVALRLGVKSDAQHPRDVRIHGMTVLAVSLAQSIGDKPSREVWKRAEQMVKSARPAAKKITRPRDGSVT